MHLVIILFALFASIFTLSKGTLNYAEPFFLIGSRMAFAGVLLIGYQYLFNRDNFKFVPNAGRPLIVFALCASYLTNTAEIWGIQHLTSNKACLLYSLTPFMAALLGFFVLKETLNMKKWMGMMLGFLGLFPMFFAQSAEEILSGKFGVFSFGELAIVFAVLVSVYGWILLKQLIQTYQLSPVMANGFGMLIGGLLSLGHSYLSGEHWSPIPVVAFGPFLRNTLLMCLISNLICYNLYGYLLKRFTATFMAFAGLVTPLFAALLGWFFLGETITWHYLASMVMFSVGLSIFYAEEIKKPNAFQLKAQEG